MRERKVASRGRTVRAPARLGIEPVVPVGELGRGSAVARIRDCVVTVATLRVPPLAEAAAALSADTAPAGRRRLPEIADDPVLAVAVVAAWVAEVADVAVVVAEAGAAAVVAVAEGGGGSHVYTNETPLR